jgi:tetratricopeptide (TPR) repeat protein
MHAARFRRHAGAALLLATLAPLAGCASSGGGRGGAGTVRPASTSPRVSCEQSPDLGAQAEAARAAAGDQRYEEALRLAEQVLQACSAHPVAVAALGEALVGSGRVDEAVERLSAVIQAQPALAYAYYWRGKAYNARHQTARMVDDFEAFLRLAPDAPEAAAVKQLLSALR